MGKSPVDITFEEWLPYVFDHPAGEYGQEWYWEAEVDWWGGSATDAIRFLTRAFEARSGCALPAWQQCIRSIKALYEQCYARHCTPHLSHADEPGAGPLNPVCYTWWDIIPLYGRPDEPGRNELDREVLAVLESTLQLDSVACRESALHGLGHWQLCYPKQVMDVIDTFLQGQAALPEALRVYAMSARRGHVL